MATLLLVLLLLPGCAPLDDPLERVGRRWADAAAQGSVDYQLAGAYAPPVGTTIVARDATSAPLAGAFSICYLNAFQTQGQQSHWWLTTHPVVRDVHGLPVFDPDWPVELTLDRTSASRRAQIVELLTRRVGQCARAGFDAVQFDNLDSWTRYPALTETGNLALTEQLVSIAHDADLWAVQTNALAAGRAGPAVGFDLVVSEGCAQFDECDDYAERHGARHIDLEYSDVFDADAFDAMCRSGAIPPLTVLRDRALSTEESPDHVALSCPR